MCPGAPGRIPISAKLLLCTGDRARYVANFASYGEVYGSLAGVVIFLEWLWLSNIAVLLGAEVNAELDHGRAMAAGLPEDVEPRDTRKLDDIDKDAVERARSIRRDS